MKTLNEDKLTEIVIDLEEIKKNKLNESWLAMFGYQIQVLMRRMFGGAQIPVTVKGNPREVDAFAKKYIQTAKDYGLEDPRTYKDKSLLKKATSKFERVTGIKWPFK